MSPASLPADFHYELYQGPGLVLIERLTGIKLTTQILEGSAYLSGIISEPPTTT